MFIWIQSWAVWRFLLKQTEITETLKLSNSTTLMYEKMLPVFKTDVNHLFYRICGLRRLVKGCLFKN